VAPPDRGEADDDQATRPDDAEDDEPETEQHSTHGAARDIRPEREIAAARDGGCTGRLDEKPARVQDLEGQHGATPMPAEGVDDRCGVGAEAAHSGPRPP